MFRLYAYYCLYVSSLTSAVFLVNGINLDRIGNIPNKMSFVTNNIIFIHYTFTISQYLLFTLTLLILTA